MRVIGIDPGSRTHAFAVLEMDGPRARWLACDSFGDAVDVTDIYDEWTAGVPAGEVGVPDTIIAIERPVWIPVRKPLFNGQCLLDTSYAAGAIAHVARTLAPASYVVELHARDWRGVLCGRQKGRNAGGQANDAMVKVAIEGRVANWPARSNCHDRDAAGVAYVGGLRVMGGARKV